VALLDFLLRSVSCFGLRLVHENETCRVVGSALAVFQTHDEKRKTWALEITRLSAFHGWRGLAWSTRLGWYFARSRV
jgi:hypothetical protein